MTERLKNSIEKLYETFQKYHSESTMIGSPNYDDLNTWNKLIFKKPLRELDEDDLSLFTGKAMTTWGTDNDYKHFLPRIFELTAELRTPYDIWIAFGKLNLAKWREWSENEKSSVEEFMISLWESIVNDNSEKAEWEFKDYFLSIAHFYPRFSDLLDIWGKLDTKGAIKHLSQYIVDEQTALFKKNRISKFYDQSENAKEFIAWILSEKVLTKIQEMYFEMETESFAEKISWAELIITTERKNKAHNNA